MFCLFLRRGSKTLILGAVQITNDVRIIFNLYFVCIRIRIRIIRRISSSLKNVHSKFSWVQELSHISFYYIKYQFWQRQSQIFKVESNQSNFKIFFILPDGLIILISIIYQVCIAQNNDKIKYIHSTMREKLIGQSHVKDSLQMI